MSSPLSCPSSAHWSSASRESRTYSGSISGICGWRGCGSGLFSAIAAPTCLAQPWQGQFADEMADDTPLSALSPHCSQPASDGHLLTMSLLLFGCQCHERDHVSPLFPPPVRVRAGWADLRLHVVHLAAPARTSRLTSRTPTPSRLEPWSLCSRS